MRPLHTSSRKDTVTNTGSAIPRIGVTGCTKGIIRVPPATSRQLTTETPTAVFEVVLGDQLWSRIGYRKAADHCAGALLM
jgi:hypothetical protein